MNNAPMSMSSIAGAIRAIVTPPAVKSSRDALDNPDGPAAVEVAPPGDIVTSALPQSTVSILIESSA